jgi:hypothetical protein
LNFLSAIRPIGKDFDLALEDDHEGTVRTALLEQNFAGLEQPLARERSDPGRSGPPSKPDKCRFPVRPEQCLLHSHLGSNRERNRVATGERGRWHDEYGDAPPVEEWLAQVDRSLE